VKAGGKDVEKENRRDTEETAMPEGESVPRIHALGRTRGESGWERGWGKQVTPM